MFKSCYIYIKLRCCSQITVQYIHISIYREDSLTEGLICKNVLFPRDFAELTN